MKYIDGFWNAKDFIDSGIEFADFAHEIIKHEDVV